MKRATILYAAAALVCAAAPAAAQDSRAIAVSSGGPGEHSVYAENDVQRKPRLLNRNQVYDAMWREYPQLLDIIMQKKLTVSIDVSMMVLEDGAVDPRSITVVDASEPIFAEAATYVARQMRFRPALVDGQPVRVRMHMPMRFEVTIAHSRGESCYEISWCRNAQGWGSPE